MPTASLLVNFVGAASLAAAQATLNANVAAAVLAGFVPEAISPVPAIPAGGSHVSGLLVEGSSVPAWVGVTAADCVLLRANRRADAAAIEAAIAAEIASQELAGVTPSLRQVAFFSLTLADGCIDAVALLFTDGSSGAAKLDGLQNQGPSIAIPAFDVDWSLGGTYTRNLDIGANAITFSNASDGMQINLVLGGSASTVTWPVAVKWAGGTPPVQTPSGIDVYTFLCVGGDIYGSVVQDLH